MKKDLKKSQSAASEIAEDCLAMRVRSLNRSLTTIYDDAFRALNITASQVTLLVAIILRESSSPGQLGEVLNIEKSTVSRNLERMRKSGWLSIDDTLVGRTQSIEATAEGHRIVSRALPLWREAQARSCAALGSRRSTKLREIIDYAKSRFLKK